MSTGLFPSQYKLFQKAKLFRNVNRKLIKNVVYLLKFNK